jgi:hypothetical protein
MRTGSTSLSQSWQDWMLIQGAYPYPGVPRRRPGALRRKIERYALLIAALGVLMALGAVALLLLGMRS